MSGVLEISLGTAGGWITPHSYGVVLHQVDRSLEELDRLAEPERRKRAVWRVVGTSWGKAGPSISLRPDVARDQRSTEELMRPSLALVGGVRSLHKVAEIPSHFSETVMTRITKVAKEVGQAGSGLTSVDLRTIGTDHGAAAIDDTVSANALQAVESASIAYGSVVGTLDLISTRGTHDRVGLLGDFGPPINCRVDQLPREVVVESLDRRVVVSGVMRRNGRGQIVRIDADGLELAPERTLITARSLRGILPRDKRVQQYIEEQRGR